MPIASGAVHTAWANVDEQGRLVLPPELSTGFGFVPGATVRVDIETHGLNIHRPVTGLAKVYVEPTSQCNLACRTCIRNLWEEPLGYMSRANFECLVEGLRAIKSPPIVFFGGFGEPLFHPYIVEMVAQAKQVGCRVELITNGTLLTPQLSRALIEAGLDLLWVSLDGARPESYADVRLGAELPQVTKNIDTFRATRSASHRPTPEIGIAFVALKRNIADLPELLRLSTRLGVSRYFVTNVLPYSPEMCSEILYARSLNEVAYLPSRWVPHLDIPRLDFNEVTKDVQHYIRRGGYNLSSNGDNQNRASDRCLFIESGSTAIAWDGSLSPCLPLMHEHDSYFYRRVRHSSRYVIGNLAEQTLNELWGKPEYVAFRHQVQVFDFSPCTVCGGCDLSEANQEDCYGNTFPTCGGCLWAQGVIQCP